MLVFARHVLHAAVELLVLVLDCRILLLELVVLRHQLVDAGGIVAQYPFESVDFVGECDDVVEKQGT